MTRRPSLSTLFVVVLVLTLCGAGGVAGAAESAMGDRQPSDVERYVEAKLLLADLVRSSDLLRLYGFYADEAKPAPLRAVAFRALYRDKRPPLGAEDRARVVAAMEHGEAAIRTAAVQVVGLVNDQALVRQVLQLAAEDPSSDVRVSALRAVRPWTRISHLFFLEAAMDSGSDMVRAEAIRSVGELSFLEISPALIGRIESMSLAGNPPNVRRASLDTLHGWRRLSWEELQVTILDTSAPDSLRAHALELSDEMPGVARARAGLLVDLVVNETSLELVSRAFQRAKVVAKGDRAFVQGVVRYLKENPQRNAATEEMATFLRNSGFSVEYRSGGWAIAEK